MWCYFLLMDNNSIKFFLVIYNVVEEEERELWYEDRVITKFSQILVETKIWYQVRGGLKKKSGFFRIFFKPFHRTMIIIVILYWKLFPVKSNWFYYEFLCKQTVVISIRLTKLWHNNDNDKSWSAGTITGFSRLIIHWMHKVWTLVLPDLCPPALEAESLSSK